MAAVIWHQTMVTNAIVRPLVLRLQTAEKINSATNIQCHTINEVHKNRSFFTME
jgi:hypothetical protein